MRIIFTVLSFALAAALPIGAFAEQDQTVTITLTGATIGPVKMGGQPWDGLPSKKGAKVATQVAKALLSKTPHGAVMSILAGPAMLGIKFPDPVGYVELYVNGVMRRRMPLRKRRNTLTPLWNIVFKDVPIKSSHLRISLMDKDFAHDDAMGTAQIGQIEFEASLADGKVHQVNIADQTNSQILFVSIIVLPEGK